MTANEHMSVRQMRMSAVQKNELLLVQEREHDLRRASVRLVRLYDTLHKSSLMSLAICNPITIR